MSDARSPSLTGRTVDTATRVVRVLLVIAVCLSVAACDKSTQPKPTTKYLLYAGSYTPAPPWSGIIAIFDCQTDSMIDSVVTSFSELGVIVSPDGKYFATLTTEPSVIFDAVARAPVATLLTNGWPLFLPDVRLLLCMRGDSALVYDMPGFTLLESWPRIQGEAVRVPGRQQVAYLEWIGHDHSKLVFFDYVKRQTVDSVVVSDEQDAGFIIAHFTFSSDGNRLYVTGGQPGFGAGVAGYDLRTRRMLFRRHTYGPWDFCQVTPDGRSVWVTEPGSMFDNPPTWAQVITILDASTGTLLDTIPTRGIHPNPLSGLSPQDIRFVPDGSKAYINCGTDQKGEQPILVVNTSTHRIERLLFGGFDHLTLMIDIAPYP